MPVVGARKGDELVRQQPAQVPHGYRQLVPWGVGFSPETSATLVGSWGFGPSLPRLPGKPGGRWG